MQYFPLRLSRVNGSLFPLKNVRIIRGIIQIKHGPVVYLSTRACLTKCGSYTPPTALEKCGKYLPGRGERTITRTTRLSRLNALTTVYREFLPAFSEDNVSPDSKWVSLIFCSMYLNELFLRIALAEGRFLRVGFGAVEVVLKLFSNRRS